jgi:mannose-6-phosphate isomerase-like protein (cupin superfamily)
VSFDPTAFTPGAGEVIGDSPDRTVEILVDTPELAMTWSRFGPGRDGAGLHIHREHSDLFYVLEGELTVKRGEGDEVAVPAGTLVYIPPMVVHGFRNAGDVDVKYLNLHAPGAGFADYMRGLRDGKPVEDFDQHDPEGVEGIRPASEIQVTAVGPPIKR